MTIPNVERIPANIGEFELSRDFGSADIPTLNEIRNSVKNIGYKSYQHIPLGEVREYFKRQESHGARIYESFLTLVVADAMQFLDQDVVDDMPVRLDHPFLVNRSLPVGRWHCDGEDSDLAVANRYVAANSCPTQITAFGALSIGQVARMPLGTTEHRQPPVNANHHRPRMLLAVDV